MHVRGGQKQATKPTADGPGILAHQGEWACPVRPPNLQVDSTGVRFDVEPPWLYHPTAIRHVLVVCGIKEYP